MLDSHRALAIYVAMATTLVVIPHDVCAQQYPQRPVRMIVNVSAGGGVDALARIAGQHYTRIWGQPFVVDNRTGAGGSIGVEMVARPRLTGTRCSLPAAVSSRMPHCVRKATIRCTISSRSLSSLRIRIS